MTEFGAGTGRSRSSLSCRRRRAAVWQPGLRRRRRRRPPRRSAPDALHDLPDASSVGTVLSGIGSGPGQFKSVDHAAYSQLGRRYCEHCYASASQSHSAHSARLSTGRRHVPECCARGSACVVVSSRVRSLDVATASIRPSIRKAVCQWITARDNSISTKALRHCSAVHSAGTRADRRRHCAQHVTSTAATARRRPAAAAASSAVAQQPSSAALTSGQ